ncbi:uncharacterized protein LOC115353389 [Aquila chrysaetos chrysaetos]|uniref:uncharacterized protein LOC115353389 n=1 Tax=Aquila chrysaetos chrysaetos TaxID=223781 RepID=UPI00117708F7|nr:uncharacterized protein LOC115353389 [Aquila chrysaetos chrysaetos]
MLPGCPRRLFLAGPGSWGCWLSALSLFPHAAEGGWRGPVLVQGLWDWYCGAAMASLGPAPAPGSLGTLAAAVGADSWLPGQHGALCPSPCCGGPYKYPHRLPGSGVMLHCLWVHHRCCRSCQARLSPAFLKADAAAAPVPRGGGGVPRVTVVLGLVGAPSYALPRPRSVLLAALPCAVLPVGPCAGRAHVCDTEDFALRTRCLLPRCSCLGVLPVSPPGPGASAVEVAGATTGSGFDGSLLLRSHRPPQLPCCRVGSMCRDQRGLGGMELGGMKPGCWWGWESRPLSGLGGPGEVLVSAWVREALSPLQDRRQLWVGTRDPTSEGWGQPSVVVVAGLVAGTETPQSGGRC